MSPSNCPFFNTPKCRQAQRDCLKCSNEENKVKSIIEFNHKNEVYNHSHQSSNEIILE